MTKRKITRIYDGPDELEPPKTRALLCGALSATVGVTGTVTKTATTTPVSGLERKRGFRKASTECKYTPTQLPRYEVHTATDQKRPKVQEHPESCLGLTTTFSSKGFKDKSELTAETIFTVKTRKVIDNDANLLEDSKKENPLKRFLKTRGDDYRQKQSTQKENGLKCLTENDDNLDLVDPKDVRHVDLKPYSMRQWRIPNPQAYIYEPATYVPDVHTQSIDDIDDVELDENLDLAHLHLYMMPYEVKCSIDEIQQLEQHFAKMNLGPTENISPIKMATISPHSRKRRSSKDIYDVDLYHSQAKRYCGH